MSETKTEDAPRIALVSATDRETGYTYESPGLSPAPALCPEDVAAALAELGYKSLRLPASSKKVLLITAPPPAVTKGGIVIPPEIRDFYNSLPTKRPIVEGLVLAAGGGAEVQVGQWVALSRLYFGWLTKLHAPYGGSRFFGFAESQYLGGVIDRPAETGLPGRDANPTDHSRPFFS